MKVFKFSNYGEMDSEPRKKLEETFSRTHKVRSDDVSLEEETELQRRVATVAVGFETIIGGAPPLQGGARVAVTHRRKSW